MPSPIEQAIRQICEEKGLAYESVVDAIEAALAAAYRKDFGDKNQNIEAKFNTEDGSTRVFDIKTVVDDMDLEEIARVEEARRAKAEEFAARIEEARGVIARLVEAYGVSGREGPVREAIIRLLPDWASPTVDTAGNVLVRVGQGANAFNQFIKAFFNFVRIPRN